MITVSIARQGVPAGEAAKVVLAEVNPLYPAKTEYANRELCQILLALNAPEAVSRTVTLMRAATTQEEQVFYVTALRNVKTGWTENLRRDYLSWFNGARSNQHPLQVVKWFTDAGVNFNNGASFDGFMKQARKDAMESMTPAEIAALGDITKVQSAITPPTEARTFVKAWTTPELLPLLDQVGKGRDFARGKAAFTSAQCILCHRYGDQGGAAGPDLTNVATRFKRQDMLESIMEPSKVLSEQYMTTEFTLKDGTTTSGRIGQENDESVVVITNPFDPSATKTISKSDIKSRDLSKTSLMPPGLLSTFKDDEILDLLAYLESMGDEKHPDFSK